MKGMTIIELLIALAILSTITFAAVPSFFEQLERYRTQANVSTFERTLRKARGLALNTVQEITICPLIVNRCSQDWNRPLTVFADVNRNDKADINEQIFFVTDTTSNAGIWKKRQNISNAIKFTPEGYAFAYASTWLFCPNSGKDHHARQLIINFQGRIRTKHYLNSEGTPYSNLRDLACY